MENTRNGKSTPVPAEDIRSLEWKKAMDMADGMSSMEEYQRFLTLCVMHPWDNPDYPGSDIGNGRLFADLFINDCRYVPEAKGWYVYDGTRWKRDAADLAAIRHTVTLWETMDRAALTIADPKTRDAFGSRLQRLNSLPARKRVMEEAQSIHPLSAADFDADPMLLNCLNGTLDLRTGKLKPHAAEDHITRLCGAEYDPAASCERWKTFIREIMCPGSGEDPSAPGGEEDQAEPRSSAPPADIPAPAEQTDQKARFLQKALGYALTGDTSWECMFILYGATTRNGKGTLMETMLHLTGDYGRNAQAESIGSGITRTSRGPSEDLARLQGARFVNISEPDKHLALSAALVKQLTGGDTVTARFLHCNSTEFRPQFKIFVNTNYRPTVTDMTLFTSERLHIIPFERHFGVQERDRSLKTLFREPRSLSGILNWCLEGLKALREEGFAPPAPVTAATEEYRRESDKTGLFIAECLIPDPAGRVRTSQAYLLYRNWCDQNGYKPECMRNFVMELKTKGRVAVQREGDRNSKQYTFFIGFKSPNTLLTG
ncbi:MAG: hypothetical protein CW338_07515 [Clostridiales bacterium]|nr:hypothetical protein [Clostridiales bacterium]